MVMFDRIYSVFDNDGNVIANFPNAKDAYSLARKVGGDKAMKLVQDAPFFVSWGTIGQMAEEDEEAERMAFADMLRALQGADDE